MASIPQSEPDASGGDASPKPTPRPPPAVWVLPPPQPEDTGEFAFKPGYRLSATGRVGGRPSDEEAPARAPSPDGEENTAPDIEPSRRPRMIGAQIPGVPFLVLSFLAGVLVAVLGMLILQSAPAPPASEAAPPPAPNTPVVDAAGAHIPIHSPPLDFAFLPRIPAGSEIVASWIAEDVGPAMPKDATMHSVVMTVLDPLTRLTFTIRPPEDGWPVGKYRLEIRHGETLLRQDRFVVP